MKRKNRILDISYYIFKIILIINIILILGDLSFAAMPYYTPPPYYPMPGGSDKAFSLINKDKAKEPTLEQLQAGKGVGSIQWSKKTGGPRDIQGNLTKPSSEDPKTIATRFLKEKKVLYGIKNPDKDLRIENVINDKYATTIHFQQMYGKVPVEAYLVVSILPNGVIHSINGEYYPELDVDINPGVSVEKAKQIAFRHGQKHDPGVRDLPFIPDSASPELLIRPGKDKDNLLWHFTGQGGWEYYIDAQDETIHNAISPMRYSFQPGSGTTWPTRDLPNGAVVSFHLNDEPNPRFGECPMWWASQWDPNWGNLYLFEDDLSTGTSKVMIYDTLTDPQNRHQTGAHCEQCDIYSCCGGDPNCNSCPVDGCCTCDPGWCKGNYPCIAWVLDSLNLSPYQNNTQVSAIYYAGKVFEFYKENFGLDGYKGDGSETRVVVNYRQFLSNDPSIAFYNSHTDTIVLGCGCGFNDQNCLQTIGYRDLAGALDTIAHEYTHAVHVYSENGILLDEGENGALAESFADIMACAAEYWVSHTVDTFANTFDYEFEEDVRIQLDPNGRVIPTRSLKDPHSSNPPQPDTYLGTYWDGDPNSIHNMCGVPNKMFYLLSEGGEHNGISVTGLGADSEHVLNAAKVMYRAATTKWLKDEDFGFMEARDECIIAAKELDNENGTHWAYSVANA